MPGAAGAREKSKPHRRPDRRRVRAIRDRLREMYGVPESRPHESPLDELVLTVLSQSTNDRNRDVAYLRLRQRFPSWESVRDAPVEQIEEAIRPGGISNVKSARIKEMLGALGDDLELEWLRDAPREEAIRFLEALPGVGRKTVACVLLFSYGRPEMPVDTHVHRVGQRLGLISPGASFGRAHDEMLSLTDPDDVYELHVNLIRHGRRTCRPKPRCAECALRRMCPYYRGVVRPATAAHDSAA